MIEIGMTRPLPFAAIWTKPTARGPLLLGLVRDVWAATAIKAIRQVTVMAGNCSLRYKREVNVESSGDFAMQINDKAPQFNLPDQNGNDVSLKNLQGKTVVLFFFPKADTPG